MNKKITFSFLTGFCSATILLFGIYLLNKPEELFNTKPYVILKSDYKIEGAGYISKGTFIRVDEGMAEGFTRYILYLNMKSGNYLRDTTNEKGIIPYWLNQ